ncbi:hypothetical protein CesoFtcFv8_008720 [Champsocephalus esox]|uniref:Uncharacterized protein n=1 Tax=Champsocephalus esox TaxID=159716 RepID=A0AAN8CB51_9TELE|nr:hypothetical protein CesoFtcFv8_008720 [Champsocephalus esox]
MRRAGGAACFQAKQAGAEHLYGNQDTLRPGTGRKHANNEDKRSKGKTDREIYFQITVEVGFYGNYDIFPRDLR